MIIKKLAIGILGLICCLAIGAGIAQAQCTNVGCLLETCELLKPPAQGYSLHNNPGREDTLPKGARCSTQCFVWYCSQSMSAKCTPNPEDIGMLAYADKNIGGDTILIMDVKRKDSEKLGDVITAELALVPFSQIEAKLRETISARRYVINRYTKEVYNAKMIEARKTGKFPV